MNIIMSDYQARDIVNLDDSGWERVNSEIEYTTRWDIHYSDVFKHIESGKFYLFKYYRGATEMQHSEPFECEGEVTIAEVEPVKVEKIEWRVVS